MATEFEQREASTRDQLDRLTKRWRKLQGDQIAARTAKENADREIQEILAEAKEAFGTDEIDQLRTQYLEGLETNEAEVAAFGEKLAQCEAAIASLQEETQ